MTIRESAEEWEQQSLSPYAALSRDSRGRDREEPPCDIRPVYQRDRDRILHCKAFRRLKHKTQVFLTPKGDHYRTRLTHTLEVALSRVCSEGFTHYEQSVRIVEKLEKGGRGLNLTWEVRDGIRNHQMSGKPATLEGKIVRYSDKIAYINHDVDDAIRGGVIREEELPSVYTDILGHSTRERLNTLIHDIVEQSQGKPDIRMSEDVEFAFKGMRKYMFDNVYTNPKAKGEEQKAENIVGELFYYYMEHPELLPNEYIERMWQSGETQERSVCDYISGMTDQYAIAKFQEFFIPDAWRY